MNNTFVRALIALAFLGAFQADADAASSILLSKSKCDHSYDAGGECTPSHIHNHK